MIWSKAARMESERKGLLEEDKGEHCRSRRQHPAGAPHQAAYTFALHKGCRTKCTSIPAESTR